MTTSNPEIARLLNRLADLLEIDWANPFRVRAYRNAAQTIHAQSRAMADMLAAGKDLSELPDIGEDIAARIATLVSDMIQIEGLRESPNGHAPDSCARSTGAAPALPQYCFPRPVAALEKL